MPELPEVETVRLQLKHKILGRTIEKVRVFHLKTVDHDPSIGQRLKGKTIEAIDRVGKLLIFHFTDESNLYLLAHLKMTGQFLYVDVTGDMIGGGHSLTSQDYTLPNKHTRVAFSFTDGSTLYFNDMRLFGYTKLADKTTVQTARQKFGPEPIDPGFNLDQFEQGVRSRKAPIKAVLLDQSFVAGLGNIYVDEALWRAKINPTRRANTLTKKETRALAVAAKDVLTESIEVGGTTFQHFLDTGGENGNFTDYLNVFGKQGTPCSRCGTSIEKVRCAGRGTHFCPHCQK
jgi:formamidopyrimidine-DNA glycosylase